MRFLLILALVSVTLAPSRVQEGSLSAPLVARIDPAVTEALAKSGAPSASIAVVKDGRVAYVQAYGTANLDRSRRATTAMRYAIGSISKQFAASAILMLAEEGKLSLDD